MASQTASNKQIAIKRQSGIGVPASGAGATGYNVMPGQGLKLNKTKIPNTVVRRDGQKVRQRHGSRSSGVAYQFPLSQGTLDSLFEAALRGTWVAPITITQATTLNGSAAAGNMTTTASTIVAATGSWLTQGVRRGQKIALTGAHAAANNGPWFRVVSVTALVITVAETIILDAVAATTWTLTIAKQLTNPTTLIERWHTVEEYLQDATKSKSATDIKISKIDFDAQPGQLIKVTLTFMGLDLAVGSSAVFTTPTYATTLPLVMMDGLIRIGGTDIPNTLTGFQWSYDMNGQVPPTLSQTGPDVFLGQGQLSGSYSMLRADLTNLTAFKAETQYDIMIDCREPDATDPKDFTSFYVGNLTLSDNTDQVAQDGPDSETVPWDAGIDDGGTDRALTTLLISSSAP